DCLVQAVPEDELDRPLLDARFGDAGGVAHVFVLVQVSHERSGAEGTFDPVGDLIERGESRVPGAIGRGDEYSDEAVGLGQSIVGDSGDFFGGGGEMHRQRITVSGANSNLIGRGQAGHSMGRNEVAVPLRYTASIRGTAEPNPATTTRSAAVPGLSGAGRPKWAARPPVYRSRASEGVRFSPSSQPCRWMAAAIAGRGSGGSTGQSEPPITVTRASIILRKGYAIRVEPRRGGTQSASEARKLGWTEAVTPVDAIRAIAISEGTETCSSRSRVGSAPAAIAWSNRSSVRSMARSPMAWTATTPPKTREVRAISRNLSGDRRRVPRSPVSAKGSHIAAVCPPRLPSANSFQPQNRTRPPADSRFSAACRRRRGVSAITMASTWSGRSVATSHNPLTSSPTPAHNGRSVDTIAPMRTMPFAARLSIAARTCSGRGAGTRGST